MNFLKKMTNQIKSVSIPACQFGNWIKSVLKYLNINLIGKIL